MKSQSRNRYLWLLPALAWQLAPHLARAANMSPVPVVEVVDLIAKPTPLIGKKVGVLAVVLCLDQAHCVLGASTSANQTISIDTRLMRAADRRRLVIQCLYAPCSEILIGVLGRKAFVAIASYDTHMPVVPAKAARAKAT